MSEAAKYIVVLAFNIREGGRQRIYARPFVVASPNNLRMAAADLRAEFADADVVEDSMLAVEIPAELIKEAAQ